MMKIGVCTAICWCLAGAAYGSGQRPHVERKDLDKPTEIQGHPCAAGYAWFYDGGALNSCRVARDVPFGEARVGAGSWIYLTSDGKPQSVFLRHDTRIGPATCMGSAMGREGITTVFFPSGKLKLCFLADDQEIQGVPCAHGGFFSELFGGDASTKFYENGGLRACRLSRAATVRGKRFARGARVEFDEDGRIK
ncbi:MAG: hypothetical protein ABSC08_09375 [Bryobacteraceae bacterium]